MLIAQPGLPLPASVKLTGRFNRVASLRATRRPLLIASAVERTSALRRNVVKDGKPAASIMPVSVNATMSSSSVKPRACNDVLAEVAFMAMCGLHLRGCGPGVRIPPLLPETAERDGTGRLPDVDRGARHMPLS